MSEPVDNDPPPEDLVEKVQKRLHEELDKEDDD
jgi:hypothetical protein